MPAFADPAAPAHGHVVPQYFEGTEEIFKIPNVVTAVLASYRGFDTLGEVGVVFTAGIGVLVLLSAGGASGIHRRKRQERLARDTQTPIDLQGDQDGEKGPR